MLPIRKGVVSALIMALAIGACTSGASSWDGLDEATPAAADATTAAGVSSQFPSKEIAEARASGSLGDTTASDVEPCRLINAAEFGAWLGQSAVTSTVLEDGDACGWKGGDDSVRMAIGVVPFIASSPDRFLPSNVDGPKQTLNSPIRVIRARWVEKYPVAQSSVLVVETANYDLVIEMSTRGTRAQDELRLGAIKFAETALGRIK